MMAFNSSHVVHKYLSQKYQICNNESENENYQPFYNSQTPTRHLSQCGRPQVSMPDVFNVYYITLNPHWVSSDFTQSKTDQ